MNQDSKWIAWFFNELDLRHLIYYIKILIFYRNKTMVYELYSLTYRIVARTYFEMTEILGTNEWIKKKRIKKKDLNFQVLSNTAQKEVVRELNSKEHELEWIAIQSEPFRGNKTATAQSICKRYKINTVSVTE